MAWRLRLYCFPPVTHGGLFRRQGFGHVGTQGWKVQTEATAKSNLNGPRERKIVSESISKTKHWAFRAAGKALDSSWSEIKSQWSFEELHKPVNDFKGWLGCLWQKGALQWRSYCASPGKGGLQCNRNRRGTGGADKVACISKEELSGSVNGLDES